MEKERVEVREQEDGTWEADRPHMGGSPVVGRGATWLEALGDLMIQDTRRFGVQSVVFDKSGKPVPQSFFGKNYQRD